MLTIDETAQSIVEKHLQAGLEACGALEGLGKGVPSLVISLLRYVVIIIPAAWLLSRSFGAQGVWHAFWLAELVTATAAQLVYKRFSK